MYICNKECYICDMKTISAHVRSIIEHTPFLDEALSESIANLSAVAKVIKPDVEKKVLQKVSHQTITMALSRLKAHKQKHMFGFRFLKQIRNISVQTGIILIIVKNEHCSQIEKVLAKKKIRYISRVSGGKETLFVFDNDEILSVHLKGTTYQNVSAVTLILPTQSIAVPGVYYPILKRLSWNGINIIELVSVGEELTFFIKGTETEKAFTLLNKLRS
jgi:hypothetical protein